MAYQIVISSAARRDLKALTCGVLERVDKKIISLADNPRPHGVEKLAGGEDLYRVRVGDYRIVYSIDDAVLIVAVARVRHRREVYR